MSISYLRRYTDFVDAGQKDLFDIHWCGSCVGGFWRHLWFFQSVVPTFLLTITQKTAFKFASPLATGWQRNHTALVFACQLQILFVRTLSMFYQTSPDHRCCSTADFLGKEPSIGWAGDLHPARCTLLLMANLSQAGWRFRVKWGCLLTMAC